MLLIPVSCNHCPKTQYGIPAVDYNRLALLPTPVPILSQHSTPTLLSKPFPMSRKPHNTSSHIADFATQLLAPYEPRLLPGTLRTLPLWRPIQVEVISSSHPPYGRAGGRSGDFFLDLAASRPLFTRLGWFLSSKQQRQVAVSTFNSVGPARAPSVFEKR